MMNSTGIESHNRENWRHILPISVVIQKTKDEKNIKNLF